MGEVVWGERTQDEMCISLVRFTPAPPTSTKFDCMRFTRQSKQDVTIMRWQGQGRRQTMSTASIRSTRGHPLPDEHGKYDLPWAQPLSTTFADYGCALDMGFTSGMISALMTATGGSFTSEANSTLTTTAAGAWLFVAISWTG